MKVKIKFLTFLLFALAFGFLFTKSALAANYSLSGSVKDSSGTAIVGATVDVYNPGTTTDVVPSTTTAQDGSYTFSNVPQGTYDVKATPPSSSGFQASTIANASINQDTILNFVLVLISTNVTVSGQVVDRDGNPLGGIQVYFSGPAAPGGPGGTTDGSGHYSIQVPPGDNYQVIVGRSQGGQSGTVPATFYIPSQTTFSITQNFTLNLQIPTIKITTHVQDPQGNPIANAGVYISTTGSSSLTLATSPMTIIGSNQGNLITDSSTDSSGNVVLWFFPPPSGQTAHFVVYPPSGSPYNQFTGDLVISSDQAELFSLQLINSTPTPTPIPTFSLTGTVYNDDNQNGFQDTGENGYSGATIRLNTGQTTTTDSNGNYTLPNLVSGTYTETLTIPNGYTATTTNPATVAVSANTTQNFGIYSQPTVGTITPSTTAPVQVNTSVSTSTTFTDGDATDTHIAQWNWGDGSTSTGLVTEPNGLTPGSITGSHTYSTTGSFIVILKVTDNGENVSSYSPQTVIAIIPSTGLTGSNLSGNNYDGANLSGQNLTGSNLRATSFNLVNLMNANLTGVNIKNASLKGANLTGADLTNSNLRGVDLTNANLTNAKLTGANLTGAIITGVVWSNTTCPNGTNSSNDNNTCVGQGGGL